MNPRTSEVETHLSVKQLAARLGISTKTVRRYVDQGKLQAVRLSARCVRFDVSQVAAALAKMSGETAQARGTT